MLSFIILGVPVPQGRPKFFRRGNLVGVYDPPASKKAKADFILQARKYKPIKPFEGAIWLDLFFYMPRPKGLGKKITKHIKKPDIDNLCKLAIDSMKGEFFKDDSQITFMNAQKQYCEGLENPHIRVAIEEIK